MSPTWVPHSISWPQKGLGSMCNRFQWCKPHWHLISQICSLFYFSCSSESHLVWNYVMSLQFVSFSPSILSFFLSFLVCVDTLVYLPINFLIPPNFSNLLLDLQFIVASHACGGDCMVSNQNYHGIKFNECSRSFMFSFIFSPAIVLSSLRQTKTS